MGLDFKRRKDYKVPYRTFTDITPEMKEAAMHALDVKNFSVLGWEGVNFEKEFAKMCGVKHAIALNAGTSALFSGMIACGIGAGDEVILSAFTFWGASHVIVNTGAIPIFVEPDPDTYNIDPAKIEAAITSKTKAIEPVHMYGQPCDMDPIQEIAEAHNLRIIEDACHACGAQYKGKFTGALGDVAGYSFVSKNLNCGGGGGMAATNHDEIAEMVESMRYLGTSGTWAEETRTMEPETIGFNFQLSEMSAAIGRLQLKELPKWNEQRNKNAQLYNELLSDIPEVQIPIVLDDCKHAFLHYVPKVKNRDGLYNYLQNQGIDAHITYKRLPHLGPFYRKRFGFKEGAFPLSEQLANEIICLPINPFVSEDQIRYVADSIRAFYG